MSLEIRSPAPPPNARDEIVRTLFELFRERGFAGVSIADISRATGLNKSSLYHYFPGGKADMAHAVVGLVNAWAGERIIEPLNADRPRAARIRAMVDAARELYGSGKRPCLVASMAASADDRIVAEIGATVIAWRDAISAALVDTGSDRDAATIAALDALSRLQGALIVARVLHDTTAFEQALDAIEKDLMAVP